MGTALPNFPYYSVARSFLIFFPAILTIFFRASEEKPQTIFHIGNEG